MTREQLEQIEARHQKGAWIIHFEDVDMGSTVFTGEGASDAARARAEQLADRWNFALMGECATDIPALVTHVRKLEAALLGLIYKHPNGNWYTKTTAGCAEAETAGALLR